MVIFLKFSVSGNAISIEATHMSLFTELFAFISFKSRKTRMAKKKLSFFQFFKNCKFSKLHIFTDYHKVNNFNTVLFWTLLAL